MLERQTSGLHLPQAKEVTSTLSKARASALLHELLSGFSARVFQRKLQGLLKNAVQGGQFDVAEMHGVLDLVLSVQRDLLPRYGLNKNEACLVILSPTLQHVFNQPELQAQVQEISDTLKIPMDTLKELQERRVSEAAAAEPVRGPPATLSRGRAIALQNELLEAYSTTVFQKQLTVLRQQFGGRGKDCIRASQVLAQEVQGRVFPRYGFNATAAGLAAVAAALAPHIAEPELLALSTQIDNILYGRPDPTEVQAAISAPGGVSEPAMGWRRVAIAFLREQLAKVSTPEFQSKVAALKKLAGVDAKGDCFRLPGRDELVLEVQRVVLPRYGFEGNRRGALAMQVRCIENLSDIEVGALIDATNLKLGMTPADCQRFRERCTPLQTTANRSGATSPQTGSGRSPGFGNFSRSSTQGSEELGSQQSPVVRPASSPFEEALPVPRLQLPQSQAVTANKSREEPDNVPPRAKLPVENRRRKLVNVNLTKAAALDLQNQLLSSYSSPAFQKKLNEIRRVRGRSQAQVNKAVELMVLDLQRTIAPKYGFEPSVRGIREMNRALDLHSQDMDVFVLSSAIQEVLEDQSVQFQVDKFEDEELGSPREAGSADLSKSDVMSLLREQLAAFSEPSFQKALDKLLQDKGSAAGDGYYVSGRAELALGVQCEILPRFGFEGSREGLLSSINSCAPFISDHEVAQLLDAVNLKLGMSRSACQRFREVMGLRASLGHARKCGQSTQVCQHHVAFGLV